jgi:Xaa-Pro aminopeptidase
LAPLDRRLIALPMLDAGEREWIDAYHARVARALAGTLDAETAAWLAQATPPLAGT